ncbi:hypothetical protein X742_10120 [Mesorhizobium sp. LNHC232B00]|nr:hypothetical protein X742_10120 [Mesorhizobium sp. LNHC232B00]
MAKDKTSGNSIPSCRLRQIVEENSQAMPAGSE